MEWMETCHPFVRIYGNCFWFFLLLCLRFNPVVAYHSFCSTSIQMLLLPLPANNRPSRSTHLPLGNYFAPNFLFCCVSFSKCGNLLNTDEEHKGIGDARGKKCKIMFICFPVNAPARRYLQPFNRENVNERAASYSPSVRRGCLIEKRGAITGITITKRGI